MANASYPDNFSILDLENTLKCPVCFELRDGHIFVCQRGHHLCDVCSRSLLTCPTCQCAITNCRNFVVETLISKYGFLNLEPEHQNNNEMMTTQPSNSIGNSAANGSLAVTTSHSSNIAVEEEEDDSDSVLSMPDTMKTLKTNNAHLKSLEMPSGVFPCELGFCAPKNVNIGVGAMIPHLRKTHGKIMNYIYNTFATVEFTSPQFVFKQNRLYHQAYHISNMGVFFFHIIVLDDDYFNMWITMAAPQSVANRFQYEINLYLTDTAYYCTSFVGQVHPCGTDKRWLLERKEIMVVPASQHLLPQQQSFEMDVKIVYS